MAKYRIIWASKEIITETDCNLLNKVRTHEHTLIQINKKNKKKKGKAYYTVKCQVLLVDK